MTNLVHIGPLTFNADPLAGDSLIVENLQGWYSSPAMRVDVEDRPNADGAFGSVRNYRAARALRFSGHLLGESVVAAQEELYDAFAAIQADGVPFQFSVETDAGTRTTTATLQGEAEVTPHPDFIGASVVARFVCYDPIKYGPAQTAQTGLPDVGGGLEYELGEPSEALYYGALGDLGRVTLTNSGTAETWPVFEVSGVLDGGFYLQNLDTGDVLRYDGVVPAGSTVSIDTRTGEVLVDDTSDASTYLTRDEFFSVPPGGTRTVQFNAISTSSGTPTMTATYRSGWW